MVVYVDICKPVGENELRKVDDFSFWLRDVINSYDTTEEIQDIKNPLQKGIYIEGTFIKVLKEIFPDEIITQSPNSGHYLNSLDVEMQTKKGLFLIDVSSVTNKKVNGYEYFYLDISKKSSEKALKICDMRKSQGFMSYKFMNQWFIFPLNNKVIVELMTSKSVINLRDLKDIALSLDKFKEMIQ